MAFFTVGVVDRDLGGMDMIQTQTTFPVRIPVGSMSGIVEANRSIWKETFRFFKIPLDIRAINCYSHLEWGLLATILWA